MDQLLGRIAAQSISFAIKSGITVVSSYAIKEGSRYIRTIKGRDREELERLQDRLETKIRIISPAIDLVEIISARGNTSLETAVSLTKSLRYDIQALGQRLAELNAQSGTERRKRTREDIKAVMDDIKLLLSRIEDAVPLINLAVTTSGVNLSASIPHTVSPSRVLQASTLLTAGDTAYSISPFHPAQVGMTFNLTLYMLFAGHSHRKDFTASDLTWQEVISKCRVKLIRIPLVYDEDENEDGTLHAIRAQSKLDEYCYELSVIEDLDDGRVHEDEEDRGPPRPFEDVQKAGIRFRVPIHQISKIFYTNSGKLLGIDESSSPVLLIKRDLKATPPRKLLDRAARYEYDYDEEAEGVGYSFDGGIGNDIEQPQVDEDWNLPKHLDPEWFAFEVWTEPLDDDQSLGDPEEPETEPDGARDLLGARFAVLNLRSPKSARSPLPHGNSSSLPPTLPSSSTAVQSNLSLLECLLRLASLQNYQQTSHLTVHDELLNLFLSDANSWLGSRESREREREDARKRIGFDPFGSPPSSPGEEMDDLPKSGKKVVKQIAGMRPGQVPQLGKYLPSMNSKAHRMRSQSPRPQLLVEKEPKNIETISQSYPTTPTPSSTTRSTHQGYQSASKLSNKEPRQH
ncbi:RanGTP-binding protein-domain-containing protein [Tirmania nivea]|nr:RanGTP-binding protein-domain-containing protein [Tirmania nivea]